jgi:dihydroorotate dehydrogenase (NAD+) catalytic subunit
VRMAVDLRTAVGSVQLPNPVLTASGTAGHGAELAGYLDLSELGAIVVKSLAPRPWAGNPAPRVCDTPAGMLNSVGLQGPGVQAWLAEELPALNERGARVVASIWGQHVEDYARVAETLAGAPGVVAVEVNVSCPNLEDRSRMFAHSAAATAAAVSASAACKVPRWAKLSPNVTDIVEIAAAAIGAGAEALVLVNTVLGMAIDPWRRTYRLGSGAGGGGLSGPAIRPVAVRAVHDCRAAFPDVGIIGVGGVARGVDVVEMMLAGANAVEVGTATFRDPRAPARVLSGLRRWCRRNSVAQIRDLVGAVHHEPRRAGARTLRQGERPLPAPPPGDAPGTAAPPRPGNLAAERPPAPGARPPPPPIERPPVERPLVERPLGPGAPSTDPRATPAPGGQRPPVTRPEVTPRIPPIGRRASPEHPSEEDRGG